MYRGGQGYLPAKITEGPYSGKTVNEFVQAINRFPDQATMDKFQESVKTGEIVEKCSPTNGNTVSALVILSGQGKKLCSGNMGLLP